MSQLRLPTLAAAAESTEMHLSVRDMTRLHLPFKSLLLLFVDDVTTTAAS
jgi:hypothetical protein